MPPASPRAPPPAAPRRVADLHTLMLQRFEAMEQQQRAFQQELLRRGGSQGPAAALGSPQPYVAEGRTPAMTLCPPGGEVGLDPAVLRLEAGAPPGLEAPGRAVRSPGLSPQPMVADHFVAQGKTSRPPPPPRTLRAPPPSPPRRRGGVRCGQGGLCGALRGRHGHRGHVARERFGHGRLDSARLSVSAAAYRARAARRRGVPTSAWGPGTRWPRP